MGRLKHLFWFGLVFFLVLEAMAIIAIRFWPDFRESLPALLGLVKSIPMAGKFLEDMGGEFFGYVAGQHFFKACTPMGTAAATLFAIGAVAGEAHRGTLEILLARPYSRARLLGERYAAGLLAVALPVLLSSATLPLMAPMVDETISLTTAMLCAVHEILFLATIYGLTFLLSTRSSSPIQIIMVVLFGAIFSFGLYMVKTASVLSPFRLADIPDFMEISRSGSLDWRVCGPLVLASALLYYAAYRSFLQRVP